MRRIIALAFLALTLAGGLTTFVVLSSDQAQASHAHSGNGGGCEGERGEANPC
jgi:hypothetical protein